MIVRHRFELQDHELGIDRSSSFMRKYLRNACVSKSPEDLTEHEKKLLGGWIRGLFETEGISDELMSMCSPKEFHLLVASLFDQSLKACQAKVLALDTLKGGLECRSMFFSNLLFPGFSQSSISLIADSNDCCVQYFQSQELLTPTRPPRILPPSIPHSRSNLVHHNYLAHHRGFDPSFHPPPLP